MADKIDFVIPWVDGADKEWNKEKSKYEKEYFGDNRNVRYRDWDLLRYWFRGVEAFAPWVNKIHFVTWGHLPEWLNVDHPKLNVVKHEDYIPIKYLPTFNSHTIELNLHRIEGLEEQFVYFNDDVFLIDKVNTKDFFLEGIPCDAAVLTALQPSDDLISNIIFNNIKVINRYFPKRYSDFNRYFSIKYRAYNIKSICMFPFRKYSMYLDFHYTSNFRKRTFIELWEKEGKLLDDTCKHRFRNSSDVNQWLIRYWQLSQGLFKKHNIIGRLYNIGDYELEIAIKRKKHKIICCNDVDENIDFEVYKNKLQLAFNSLLSDKSVFEK